MQDRNENRVGYKKTKVGWIPVEWDIQAYGNIFERIKLAVEVNISDEYQEIGIRSHGKGIFHKTPIKGSKLGNKSVFYVYAPALIFNIVFAWEQAVAVTDRNDVGLIASHRFPMYKPKYKNTILNYFRYFFLSKQGKYLLELASPGGAGRNKTLGQKELSQLPVPFPPFLEQNKIAEILTTWDTAISQTCRLIEVKKKKKKGLMQQLLTGKKRLPGFTKKWKTFRFGQLFEQISRSVNFDDEAEYSLLSVRRHSAGLFLRGYKKGHEILTKQLFTVNSGDFIISKMQVVHGATAVVNKEHDKMHISGSYITLRASSPDIIKMPYIKWLSKTPFFYHLTYLASYGVHIEKMTFNLRFFLKSKILLPEDTVEQSAIADILQAADNEIKHLESKLKALEKQKRGLMQKLLTGEVRVKV